MSCNVTTPWRVVTHCCDSREGGVSPCLEYFLPNEQSWRCPLTQLIISGFDPLHPAAEVVQHHVHWRGGGGGVLQHRGGAAPQEAGDQPGSGISREVQISDPGETTAEWLQREVSCGARRTCMVANLDNRKNVDPQIVKWNARKKLHYTEEVILPDPFFLLPIILNFLTSSWLNFSVEHENGSLIVLFFCCFRTYLPFFSLNAIPSIDVIVFRFKWAESAQNRLGIRYLEACPTRSQYPRNSSD